MIVIKEIFYECTCGCSERITDIKTPKAQTSVGIGSDRLCLNCGNVMFRRITTGEEN